MSKEITTDEVKEKFLEHVRVLVRYWDNQNEQTSFEKLSGLAFSILSTIDGSSLDLPKFILAPDPHKEDKEYHIDENSNYYPDNNDIDIKSDISGGLHELLNL